MLQEVEAGSQKVSDDAKDRRSSKASLWLRRNLFSVSCCRVGIERCCPLLVRWYTPVLLLTVASCLHADQNLAAPNLTAIAKDFGFNDVDKDKKLGGQVQLGFFFVGGFTSLFIGPLADRLNRINLLLGVVLLGAVPCVFVQYVPSGDDGFMWFFLSRILTGISVGGSFPLLYSLCGDVCLPAQRTMISAAMGVATAVGVALGQLLSGFLGPRYGWRSPFPIVAYPAIASAFLLWFTVADPRFAVKKKARRAQSIEMSSKVDASKVDEEQNCLVDGRKDSSQNDVDSPSRVEVGAEVAVRRHTSVIDPAQAEEAVQNAAPDTADPGLHAHAVPSDCSKFGKVFRGQTNRLLLCQGLPGCVSWSTVSTYLPDYLHSQQGLSVGSATLLVAIFGVSSLCWALGGAALGQHAYGRNKGYLAYVMSFCTAIAVLPFLILINSPPDVIQSHASAEDPSVGVANGNGFPSAFAFTITAMGGIAAVTAPNCKGLLMNVNTSSTRGTVFALVTLTDDVGKGLGPEVVALIVVAVGRRYALSAAMCCWLLSSICLLFTRWTIEADVQKADAMDKLPREA